MKVPKPVRRDRTIRIVGGAYNVLAGDRVVRYLPAARLEFGVLLRGFYYPMWQVDAVAVRQQEKW